MFLYTFTTMMFKQPSKRINFRGPADKVIKPQEGTLMYSILKPPETVYPVIVKGPIHHHDDYIRLFKRNNEEMGIPFVEREYPEYVPRVYKTSSDEPKLEYSDQVQVSLKVLKTGVVRVKVNAAIATLDEKYYSLQKRAPIKNVIQAYKSHGFSDAFIEKIKKGVDKNVEFGKKVGGILDKIFDKQPIKKIKKKKEVEVEVEAEVEPENDDDENDDEDVVPEEDGGLDVEPDEDEIVEEEEYISDAE